MTITARYASSCAICRQPITVGASIEWIKGQPARHARCAAGVASGQLAAPVVTATPRYTAPRRAMANGDTYTARNGQPKVFGCSACTRGDRMCRACQHDEYDM